MARTAIPSLALDESNNDLFFAARRIRLTALEFHLVRLLLEAEGELCTNADLLAAMDAPHSFYAGLASLRALRNSIHRKLRTVGLPDLLVDVHGVGLRLEPSRSEA